MGSGDPTFPPWRRYGPSSIGPYSPRQRALFNSSNSFLMFQEASHRRLPRTQTQGRQSVERRGVVGKGLCGKGWRTRAELLWLLPRAHLPRKGEEARGHPAAPAVSQSSRERSPGWAPQPSWVLRATSTERLLCANPVNKSDRSPHGFSARCARHK